MSSRVENRLPRIGSLILASTGRNVGRVILGGGQRHFLPRRELNAKNPENAGRREDGRNLIEEWQRDKKSRGLAYKYVSRKRELDKVDPMKVDYLLGLFSAGHMAYESDRDKGVEGEPSIAQMTRRAIEVLRKNPRGYLLMVEGLKKYLICNTPFKTKNQEKHHEKLGKKVLFPLTATAGSDVVQSRRPIFDEFFQHLWPYIINNTANVVFQLVKRLWLIRIDQ
ncbi:membrane-bound alkaline phosphatase [Trichonephila clavipes]|nr:membrane-bound alkaline phosphatase [Trichonephila clavipes]